jgi:hypothetical protein
MLSSASCCCYSLQVLGKGTIGAAGMPPEMVYTNGLDCVRKMVRAQLAEFTNNSKGKHGVRLCSRRCSTSCSSSVLVLPYTGNRCRSCQLMHVVFACLQETLHLPSFDA